MVACSSSVRAVACSNLSQVPPLHMHVGSDRLRAGRQEVGKCSTRGESWGMYITCASAKIANKAEPTLALKPRGDVTRNPKQGYQWPQKKDMCPPKTLKKKKKKDRSVRESEVRSANQIAGNKVRVRGRIHHKIPKFLTFDSNSTSDRNQMC